MSTTLKCDICEKTMECTESMLFGMNIYALDTIAREAAPNLLDIRDLCLECTREIEAFVVNLIKNNDQRRTR